MYSLKRQFLNLVSLSTWQSRSKVQCVIYGVFSSREKYLLRSVAVFNISLTCPAESRTLQHPSANIFLPSEISILERQLQCLASWSFRSTTIHTPVISHVQTKNDHSSFIRLWFQTFHNTDCFVRNNSHFFSVLDPVVTDGHVKRKRPSRGRFVCSGQL